MMKPILFNTKMVKAILEDRKTVTRRLIKPRYKDDEYGFQVCHNADWSNWYVEKMDEDEGGFINTRYVNPPYQKGDILYVRETYAQIDIDVDSMYFENSGELYRGMYIYKADGVNLSDIGGRWHPSIHMPKEAARIFLRVTDIKVEKLQDITGKDVLKEGINSFVHPEASYFNCNQREMFEKLWNSTISKKDIEDYGWNANPWVWVISFERINKSEVKNYEQN